ncbi:congested-like trachea protein isoform X2 [Prorops nasuta]
MLAPLITAAPLSAISICTYHSGKNLIMKPEQSKATNGQLMFAGIFSGICISPITIPAERIKCLLQIQVGGKRKYKGFLDCGVKLLKEGGIPNIFVGTGASLLRDLPATGVYFLTYEWTMEFLLRNATKMTWEPIIAGGLAGIASWAIAMPADVMKSQIQSSPLGTYPKGMRSAFPLILRKEGWFGLFRGTVPVLIRAFPTNAACFYGLEMGLKFLNKHFPWL